MTGLVLRVVLLALAIALGLTAVRAIVRTPDGARFQAEFSNAHGLVVGNEVRIDGAPAGRVDAIDLTDRGTARVTMRLDRGLRAPRADATAAIRPVDLLGDTYVAVDRGRAPAPLAGPIPVARTLNDPRLDDLLSVFRAPDRAGMKAMLVELGLALDSRGGDLNRAALGLRGTLAAGDSVLRELDAQNTDLGTFVRDAERVVVQGAARRRDLGGLLAGLSSTLATTAAHGRGLDAGLATLPPTLEQARGTAGRLAATARAAVPLARELAGAAGNLATAGARLGPFLQSAQSASEDLRPALRTATGVLAAGGPTLRALRAGLGGLRAAGPDTGRFLSAFATAAPDISQGFFVNFPDQASEPGRQPFDPFADPRRDYWRGEGVMSCESFGLPIKPGCLEDFLATTAPRSRRGAARRPSLPQPGGLRLPAVRIPDAVRPPAGALRVPSPPVPEKLKRLIGKEVGTLLAPPGTGSSSSSSSGASDPTRDLLGFLLGR